MSEIHITGLAELGKFMEQLPIKIEKNISRSALRSGAKLIEAQAKANVPVGPPSGENKKLYGGYAGALRDSIRVTTRRHGSYINANVVAGGKNKKTGADVFYAHLIEFTGALPHLESAQNRKGLSFGGLFFQSVNHPGMQAHPFLRPALDARAQDAMIAVANYIKNRLTKQGLDTADIKLEGDT